MLVAILCFGLGVDQLLLWRFLGRLPLWGVAPALALAAAVPVLLARGAMAAPVAGPDAGPVAGRPGGRPGAGTVAVATLVAALVLLLGGEGRLVWANTDWQVRYAVLRDLTAYPWPFVYDVRSAPDLLRAPLGVYLAPALAGKWLGQAGAEAALLVQDTGLLALLFTLGAWLFDTARARAIALAVFLGFSGMDMVGQLLLHQPLLLSSDRWNVAVFEAPLASVFAGPQHALAGWIGAALFLLWRDRKVTLAAFLAPVPLLAQWSPLAVAGIAPFAALAGAVTLARGELRARDVLLPAATSLLALPGLCYLAAGSGTVGGGAARIDLSQWVIFELIEVGPYLVGLAFLGRRRRLGGATLGVAALVLLLAPLLQVSTTCDFVTRTSIAALAILAVGVGEVLAAPADTARRLWRVVLLAALALGVATPAFAIVRALAYPPAPEVVCSYFGVVPTGADTYVVPLSRVDRRIAPVAPARIRPHDPARCWTGKWPNPLYHEFPERVAPEDRDERL